MHQHGKRLFSWKMSNEPGKGWIKAAHDSAEVGKEVRRDNYISMSMT
jgi:hypothetical protein